MADRLQQGKPGLFDVIPGERTVRQVTQRVRAQGSRFGTLVADARIAMSFTQQQLAEALGVSRAFIAGIETGRTQITVRTLVKLCQFLSVTPNDLLEFYDAD